MTNSINFEVGKYFIYATLLMPGIIMITLRRWITPINTKFFSKEILRFIGYGVLNFVVFLFFNKGEITALESVMNINIVMIHITNWMWFTIWQPIILGLILCGLDRTRLFYCILSFIFRKPVDTGIVTTWEEISTRRLGEHIKVTLVNGEVIRGILAKGSKISSSVENKDIFITDVTDDGSEKYESGSSSIWIKGDEIRSIVIENVQNSPLLSQHSAQIVEAIQSFHQSYLQEQLKKQEKKQTRKSQKKK